MYIHKSHSKKDIIAILNSLNVFPDTKKSKREIIEELSELIPVLEYNATIPHLTALKDTFKQPSLKKRVSVEKKAIIMTKAKKIIKFYEIHYLLTDDLYKTAEEVNEDAIFIHHYGDIPTVRRALRFYNLFNKKIGHVNPIISLDIMHQLREKKKIKDLNNPQFSLSRGNFKVEFN